MFDAIVIGGGLSGAVFAHHFSKSGKVLILEKADRLGGAIHTVRPFGGAFFAELGAHTIYNSYLALIRIIDELFPASSVIANKSRGYLIKAGGSFYSIASQLSLWGLARGALRLPFCTKDAKSVREYYSIFGKNYERVILPALSAIICQDASEIAADIIMKRRSAKRTDYPRSFTLTGGISALIEKIAAQDNITVNLSTAAEKAIKTDNGYTVITSLGEEIRAERLVIAVDALEAAKLLEWAGDIPKILNSIPASNSRALLFAAKKVDYTFPLFGYIISRDGDFRGAVSRDQTADDEYRAAALHFLDGEDNIYDAFSKLKPLLQIAPEADIFTQTERFCLPRLFTGHVERMKKVEELLKGIKNLHLLGNYFGGLSMQDCAARAADEAERAINAKRGFNV
ncbi:MAG: NAD(P)-binding protein [Deferribacteraceae bacterium]|jgi:protoporphyrinogen oxidase|nr:NAD(P)-binding protein [Deferribacteraceae bacterium]